MGEQAEDEIKHPRHYNSHPSGIEAIVICEHFSFNLGNSVKYIWRAGLKSEAPEKDLAKAIWYLQREIERLTEMAGHDTTAEISGHSGYWPSPINSGGLSPEPSPTKYSEAALLSFAENQD